MTPSTSPSRAVYANFPSEHLTIAAGVAIFHLASSRVVLCHHTRDHYYFLPKGRRNACEDTARGAEREGFEESGYRNRLLKLPLRHRQPDADEGHQEFVTEAVWTQLLQLSERSQYILHWYIAETIPPQMEMDYRNLYASGSVDRGLYRRPPAMQSGWGLRQRIEEDVLEDGSVYEPVRHEGTGVDEEELLYDAKLVPLEEAYGKLRGSIMEDVVRRGWEAIQLRMKIEEERVERGSNKPVDGVMEESRRGD